MNLHEAAEAVEQSRRPAVGCDNHELVASEDLEALREAVAAGHRSVTPEQIAAIGRARQLASLITESIEVAEEGWGLRFVRDADEMWMEYCRIGVTPDDHFLLAEVAS